MPNEHTITQAATTCGQDQLFKFWNELDPTERSLLVKSLKDVNFLQVGKLVSLLHARKENIEERLLPPNREICGSLCYLRRCQPQLLDKYYTTALEAVRDGKVAVLLLAGGQGTRLGVKYPKGLFKPDLPSGRSLYDMQAGHMGRVCDIVTEKYGIQPQLPWYIMTSENTSKITEAYFAANNYFNLDRRNVRFFSQFTLPAFDYSGKILLESKCKISRAPDGNGGLYRALRERGILDDMLQRGIEFVQIYCVDNILVKVPDLHFIGFSISKSAECAAQVVQKVDPTEPIGIVGMVDGRYRVVEYSEISPETAALYDADESCLPPGCDNESDARSAAGDVTPSNCNGGDNNIAVVSKHQLPASTQTPPAYHRRLLYSHGNICVHFATRDFLCRVSHPEVESHLPHHIAKKKVPFVDLLTGEKVEPSQPNAIKLEKFVFDVFPLSDRFAIWEVPREEYFSPIKNGPQATHDCPQTARRDLLAYHARLAMAAGARFVPAPVSSPGDFVDHEFQSAPAELEISPSVSYCGENLSCLYQRELCGVNLLDLDPKTKQPVLIPVINDSHPPDSKHLDTILHRNNSVIKYDSDLDNSVNPTIELPTAN